MIFKFNSDSFAPLVLGVLLTLGCAEEALDQEPSSVPDRPENPGTQPTEQENPEPDVPLPQEPGPEPQDPELPGCDSDPTCISTFPSRISADTTAGTREWDSYDCASETNESGPELVYRVVIQEPGFFSAQISGEPEGVDVDVHLLLERDPTSCMDRGNFRAGSWLEAGEYWLVADTWVNDEGVEFAGAFDLDVNVTTSQTVTTYGINEELANDALRAFSLAWQRDETRRFEYTLTDFSLHSSRKRQWVFDLNSGELLFNLHTAHGEGSIEGEDLGIASKFSNILGSHQSSLGLMRTDETYVGDYGYSVLLDGLEAGFNDRVREREIVVHPWFGNAPNIIERDGWVTPSWGCATLEESISDQVIDTISFGTLMFFWYPDLTWRSESEYLN